MHRQPFKDVFRGKTPGISIRRELELDSVSQIPGLDVATDFSNVITGFSLIFHTFGLLSHNARMLADAEDTAVYYCWPEGFAFVGNTDCH